MWNRQCVKDIFEVKDTTRDLFNIRRDAIRNGYLILIIVKDAEQEAVTTFELNILKGSLKIAVFKARGLVNAKASTLIILQSRLEVL